MVDEVKRIVGEVVARVGPGKVGVHCHNDCGLGVAVSMAGVQSGAVLVQGTINGFGERTGNANLVSIIPNLLLKLGYDAFCRPQLPNLRQLSLFADEQANRNPDIHAPYVGASAFAHKGGVHANAAQKVARSYEHIVPELVGNRQRVLISDMSGRSSVVMKARELGVELEADSPALKELIDEIKRLEFLGYEYEAADAETMRRIQREAMRGIVPDAIVDRGEVVNFNEMVRTTFARHAAWTSGVFDSARTSGYFSARAILERVRVLSSRQDEADLSELLALMRAAGIECWLQMIFGYHAPNTA